MPSGSFGLSKSLYRSGLQCVKALWWQVHEPDAPELSAREARDALLEQGREVGERARDHVPGGILTGGRETTPAGRLQATREAVESGARVIYEAAFERDGVVVLVDILERGPEGWTLIEVKSSTDVKDEHLPDIAVQAWVLRGAGIEVRRCELMHLDPACRFPDLSNLFVREDVTAQAEAALVEVPDRIAAFRAALAGPLPEVAIGGHCSSPRECPFKERCWREVPPHSLWRLYRLSRAKREELQRLGIETIAELPDGEALSGIQDRQRRAVRANSLIVEPGLAAALSDIKYPITYLDFETISPAIPLWPGMGPYHTAAVQVSVHVETEGGVGGSAGSLARGRPERGGGDRGGADSGGGGGRDDRGGGELRHQEWLASGPEDPRPELARQLVRLVPPTGSVIAYYAGFEAARIDELAALCPEQAPALAGIKARLWDPLPVVRDYVYHPDFCGSFSLKSVLPALVPGAGYADLEVQDGAEASSRLMELLVGAQDLSATERAERRRVLLDYCERDTYAMVLLLRRLRELAAGRGI